MPAVNPAFQQKIHELTAFAYQHQIDCPPLIGINNWLAQQSAATPISARTGSLTGQAVPFDDAVLAAVKSSPNGVGLADLRAILAPYARPPNQIETALGRLTRAKTIEKRGDLWYMSGAGSGTGQQPRRRTRGTAAAPKTAAPPRARAASPTAMPLGDRVYALIPMSGGIAQTAIKVTGVKPNIIGTSLARLKKAGRLVEQNGVWFRSVKEQQA
ncbi:MAG: hypothetical protein EPO09_21705, partial [Aquabacterium sp.]